MELPKGGKKEAGRNTGEVKCGRVNAILCITSQQIKVKEHIVKYSSGR